MGFDVTLNTDETVQNPERNIQNEVDALRIGAKIRKLRHRRNFTLQSVSELSGLSKSLLSQIENDITVPPIATLVRIARSLGVTIGHFFKESQTGLRISLVPQSERSRLPDIPQNRPGCIGYLYQALSRPIDDKHMEPFWVEYPPHTVSDMTYYNHPGEEFIYVQNGELEVRIGERTISMKPGDSLYFDASLPHATRSLNGEKTTALVVIYAPEE
jgi:transcriptional regulator with XRE-family HTH domain